MLPNLRAFYILWHKQFYKEFTSLFQLESVFSFRIVNPYTTGLFLCHSKNIRKPQIFMFSRGIERNHWQMSECEVIRSNELGTGKHISRIFLILFPISISLLLLSYLNLTFLFFWFYWLNFWINLSIFLIFLRQPRADVSRVIEYISYCYLYLVYLVLFRIVTFISYISYCFVLLLLSRISRIVSYCYFYLG